MSTRGWLVLDLAVKAALLLLLGLALAFPDAGGFEGKGMTSRIVGYPVAILIVPAVWWLAFRRSPYPYAADVLFTLPFLIDTAGNALDLYDTVDWWDDANHLVNWAILVAGFGTLIVRLPIGRLNAAALALGFGAVTHILWELVEYFAFIRDNPDEFDTAYTDTLGDLALSLTGSAIGALLTGTLLQRLRRG
ncbi:MAG TPA: hypothetical protein VLB86_14595 [Gaiellaceae bacterium]|nr:hypothetical protein [Gaiellaceae bacterium]